MTDSEARRKRLWALGLATVACLWGAALFVFADLLRTDNGMTFVQANGQGVLVVVALPAVASVLAWLVLLHRCRRGGDWTGPVALGLGIVVMLEAILGALTIGPFLAPAAVLMLVASQMAPLPPAAQLANPAERPS